MKNYLERLAFIAILGSLVATAWLAVETEASTPARPALVEVAVAAPVETAMSAPVETTMAAPVSEAVTEQPSPVTSAPATVLAPEERLLMQSPPVARSTEATVDAAAGSPATIDQLAAPAADGGEELATTSSDEVSHGSIVVEHTIAAIPDPPDVGASGQRRSFEVEAGDDAHDPWLGVRNCESHNNYSINTGNGFYGAYQFTISSWDWVAELIGRTDLIGVRPDLAAPWDQDRLAQALAFEVAGGGLRHWPVCGRFYG